MLQILNYYQEPAIQDYYKNKNKMQNNNKKLLKLFDICRM